MPSISFPLPIYVRTSIVHTIIPYIHRYFAYIGVYVFCIHAFSPKVDFVDGGGAMFGVSILDGNPPNPFIIEWMEYDYYLFCCDTLCMCGAGNREKA